MRMKLFAVSALLLGFLLLLPTTSEAYPNEKNGFRGLEWGTKIETQPDGRTPSSHKEYVGEPGKVEFKETGKYIRRYPTGQEALLGGARIDSIIYLFRCDQLTHIEINFAYSKSTADAALAALEANFGLAEQTKLVGDEFIEYIWKGENTTIEFTKDNSAFSRLNLTSTKLDKMLKDDMLRQIDQQNRKKAASAVF